MSTSFSHYRLEEKLRSGGVGVVYRAVDERLGRNVAIKFLSPELARQSEMRERFIAEAQAASSLDHPNICTIFEIDETPDGELFIVMAYYPGETLDGMIETGPLDLVRALRIAIQVAGGLAAAHEELIVHRDIKPGNLMILGDDLVKILDFGLAKLAGRIRLTDPRSMIGTPAYMSPEQVRSEAVDSRTDIWSLGVVLFEMVTGRLPFRGGRIEAVVHSILNSEPQLSGPDLPVLSRPFLKIIRRCLAKSPRERYPVIEEMTADLQSLITDVDSDAITLERPVTQSNRSVAVLPFIDMSPESDQGYLADGIAEDLAGVLSRVPDLSVASRTSAFQFRGRALDIREIGHRLNVDSVVEGSIRKVGNRIRVSVQLVDVDDGYRLWSERFDREMEDLLTIQDEIAHSIAEALEATFSRQRSNRLPQGIDGEAYKLYLQGRQFFHQHRRKSFEIARQTFERSIEIVPDFALAWAGIANCGSFLKLYFNGGEEALKLAEEASERAIRIAPDLAEARVARGLALTLSGRYEDAAAELDKAIGLDPESYDASYFYGRTMFALGRFDDAEARFRRAVDIDPSAHDAWYLLGMTLRRKGSLAAARAANVKCVEAAKRRVDLHPEDTRAWTMGAAVFADIGEPETSARWLARALDVDPDDPLIQYNAACVYVALGRTEEALASLTAAYRLGVLADWISHDPDLDPIREDPKFQAIIGLSKSPPAPAEG